VISRYGGALQSEVPDHYATLGVDPHATTDQIRTAYRFFAKQHHPDLNPAAEEARIQQLNAAHEILGDPARRRAYDRERNSARLPRTTGRVQSNVTQDAYLRVENFLRGASLDVTVKDPANPGEPESYRVMIPPMTVPGAKFRLPRETPFAGGFVEIRVRALPGFRFKVSDSNLRLDLRISARRAANGGSESIMGVTGGLREIQIPARVRRGEILRIAGEGLPKARGGRGDLLVRVIYRPEVRISRTAAR
jgi:DnaJ-class molecular chaperone